MHRHVLNVYFDAATLADVLERCEPAAVDWPKGSRENAVVLLIDDDSAVDGSAGCSLVICNVALSMLEYRVKVVSVAAIGQINSFAY